jgi:RNA polymerase sigma factor (TIGR02999 family)
MTVPSEDLTPEQVQAAKLIAEVYTELRRWAASRIARLPPGQTLQPTALVPEAYLRQVGKQDPGWEGRRHFFAAAVRAMRDVLIEQARRKDSLKRGGRRGRVELSEGLLLVKPSTDDLLAVDEVFQQLQAEDPLLAELVLMRFYAGMTVVESAQVLGVSASTVQRLWCSAKAWLPERLREGE